MNLTNYFWYFPSVVPTHICDQIVRYGNELKKEEVALTGNLSKQKGLTKKQLKDLHKIRDSNIVWLSDPWIYKEIHPYIHSANKQAGWNYDWDWSEACQFTIYRPGQFYDWHQDCWDKPYEEEGPQKGKIRKLSVTVSLSDVNEYEGGELEFDFKNLAPNKKQKIITCKEILPKGSIVVFPSFVWHRVKPVTSGTRHSLVIWNVGYPYK